jgi:hypothetical protein
MPRDITAARPNGSMLPTATSFPSGNRNNAACSPPGNSTATPRPGNSRFSGHARVHVVSTPVSVYRSARTVMV